MPTDITVGLKENSTGTIYILIVIPPGAKDTLDGIKTDFDVADINLINFKSKIIEILGDYQDETTIWYKYGSLNSGETDTNTFPDDSWKKVLGDDESNTNILGGYKVILLGLGSCGRCSINLDVDCTPFFVVPEFAMGTISPFIASTLCYLYSKRRK